MNFRARILTLHNNQRLLPEYPLHTSCYFKVINSVGIL